jgi:capsular exopolysaccharide synthesis family protein
MHTRANHTNATFTQLIDAPTRSFGFAHFFGLLLSKAWLIVLFAAFSLLAAAIYLKLAPKLYESRTVIEVESKSGQAKLTQLQSALEGELLERQANLTKAQAARDSALAELQADERLVQRGLISALDFKKAQIAASELSANYEVEKRHYETARISNVQAFGAGDNGGEQDLNVDEDVKTVEQAMVSDTLLLGVLKSNGLEKDPSFAPPKKDGSVYLDSELVARFRSRVKAAVRHGTRLIDVSVKDTDPRRAQRLAEAIVEAFIDQNPEGFHANDRLGQEADRLKAKLQDAEQAVQKYREDHGSVSHEDNQNIKIAIPDALVREVDADRALYESVVTRMKATDVAKGIWGKNIRVVETPLVAAKPVDPAPLKILLLSLLTGVALGCGLVISIDMADNSMRTIDQVERISGLSALAAIPESKRRNRKREAVLTSDPASYEAEAFRTLRTSISFLDPYTDHKTLLFTSANPGEGKTYCCLNYSVALAQTGLRTLLIDADIRRPRLCKIALADRKAQGLTDCLAGQANVIDCCKPTGIENLFLLPAGQRRSTPSELFASCDFVSLLKELTLHFDRIVLDSAPINAVSDTQLIARHVQSICFVIRAIKTPADAITRACALLRQAGTSPDGFVFNRMPKRSRGSYYYSEYAGGYAKGATKQRFKAKQSKGPHSNQGNNLCAY